MFKIKIIITFAICILWSASLLGQDSLIIEGTAAKSLEGKILILKRQHYLDTCKHTNDFINQEYIVKDGKFSFSAKSSTIEIYTIVIKDRSQYLYLALSPKKTTIHLLDSTLKKYRIVGNDADSLYKALSKYTSARNYAPHEINKNVDSLINYNPNTPLNIFMLLGRARDMSEKDILRLYHLIPDSNKTNSAGKELKFIIENLFVGQIAPDFSQTDTAGSSIKLSDFRGKYLFLDFWGSWCGPCRIEHPAYIKAFKSYQDKNFDILSFSLDEKKEAWLAAIYEDGVDKWKHVSNLTGVGNYVSRNMFKVIEVPVNYLIDPEGKIIAKNLTGKQLISKLKELKL